MSSKDILLKKNMAFLLVAILSIGIVTEISLVTYASALNYYFNCVTKNVNKDSNFEMQEAFVCYDNVFKGAQKYSNEPYQNPDLTNLNNIKPVADYTSDVSTNDDEKTNDIITPSKVEEEVGKSNGNPAAEDATETSNGNPAAEDATETSNGNPAAEDATETSNGNPAAEEDENDLQLGGTESDAKPFASEETPNVDITDKPSSGPQSQSPVNENSNTKGSPNLGTNAGVFDISPFYKSFDLPFTAVIPQ